MRSPKDMQIIQIDITNACIHECSNCTRFCGHHKKPYFMEFDMIKKAIDSLKGFEGTIGIMGGEPTLHPKFEKIVKYIATKIYSVKVADRQVMQPQEDFYKMISDMKLLHSEPYFVNEKVSERVLAAGLFSSMCHKYLEHFELIQDVFKKQVLNDHGNAMYHDPLLVSRKELGIPDDEWEVLRDNCWIQNEWSASITPKGAFFCEVAGTLDLLFDGPGGWEVESDWWKREVADFKDQLHWCELCGAACETYTRDANEEIDDISPVLYEKLNRVGSKKIKKGKVHIMQINVDGTILEESKPVAKRFAENFPYAECSEDRFNADKSELYPKSFEAIILIDKQANYINQEYKNLFFEQFKITHIVFNNAEEKKEFNILQNEKCYLYSLDSEVDIKELLTLKQLGVYTAVFSGNLLPKSTFVKDLSKYVFNPGALLYTNEISNNEMLERFVDISKNKGEKAEFMIFNPLAYSLKSLNNDFSCIKTVFDMKDIWIPEKVVAIDEDLFPKNTFMQVGKGLRYAVYGTGIKAEEDILCIKAEGGIITCVFDGNEDKKGTDFHGITVDLSENIVNRKDEFDIIVIASFQYYEEIRNSLLEKGFNRGEFLYYQHRE